MDPKGQNILFRSQLEQKDLMIQMLSERINEKDETIKDLKETIAGLQETLNEFQRKLFGTSSEKTKKDEKTEDEKSEETVTIAVKSH